MNSEFAVILVNSTSQAMQIEKMLNHRGFPCKLIPVPRHLSSDCGMSVRILRQNVEEIRALLKESQIHIPLIENL